MARLDKAGRVELGAKTVGLARYNALGEVFIRLFLRPVTRHKKHMGRDGGALFLRQAAQARPPIESVRHYWLMPRDGQAPAKKRKKASLG